MAYCAEEGKSVIALEALRRRGLDQPDFARSMNGSYPTFPLPPRGGAEGDVVYLLQDNNTANQCRSGT